MRIINAILIGVVTGLVAWVIGTIAVATGVAVISSIGAMLINLAVVFGVISALYAYIRNENIL